MPHPAAGCSLFCSVRFCNLKTGNHKLTSWKGEVVMAEWKQGLCNFCGINCDLEFKVEDDHILDVRPHPEGWRSEGAYCCRKGRSTKYFQENPERLNHPLKKVGDHFEEISWEQAISEISEKAKAILDKYGPKSFAYLGGALSGDQSDTVLASFMRKAIGSPYTYNPVSVEFMAWWWACGRVVGHQAHFVDPDEAGIDVFIAWGWNGYVSHNMREAKNLIRHFSEDPDKMMITVDPRMSETARMADLHIMPRPGSDALMIRGLIALILEKGWQDQTYLDKWCADWDQAKNWFDGFNYKEAFELCQVSVEQMEELAELLTTKTWGVHPDVGLFFNRHSTITLYLLVTLMAITGNLQVKGNKSMEGVADFGPLGDERTPGLFGRSIEGNRFPVTGVFPGIALHEDLHSDREDRLRVCFASKTNIVHSFPDTESLKKGLSRLDLFVVTDIVMTETARLADYVLPGKTGFEEHQFAAFQFYPPHLVVNLKHPFIGQIGERRPSCDVIMDLAKAMGLIPPIPQEVLDAAVLSVEKRDIVPFMGAFMQFAGQHHEYTASSELMMLEALRQPAALGSAARALLRLAFASSPIATRGEVERAGIYPPEPYKSMKDNPETAQLYYLSLMDQCFWKVDDSPTGAVIGECNPDPEEFAKEHIYYPDHKIRLYDDAVDRFMWQITPKQEKKSLNIDNPEYPMIISAGQHADGGMNQTMRNPDTYKYRDPFVLSINPDDAGELGIENGEVVRIVTENGQGEAPANITWQQSKGYCMVPHHFGQTNRGETYGFAVSSLISYESVDEITGDPLYRYIPCRIEKIKEVQA